MKTVTDPALLSKVRHAVILAAGFFDGLHIGHRKVIDQTVARAKALGGEAWILTFDVHPLKILQPGSAPPLLTSIAHKMKLLSRSGVDGCLVMPFTRALTDLEPEDFVRRLRSRIPALSEIIVGSNWHFGKGAKGNPGLLSRMGREMNFEVRVVKPMRRRGKSVSSTRIRTAVKNGRLKEAADMLGRPFGLLGTVTKGRAIGRKLGFRTANLALKDEVLPPFGVYAVHAAVGEDVHDGVANLGVKPTFDTGGPRTTTLELHLFDVSKRLYGRDIEVLFVSKLRNERRFDHEADLKQQIIADIRRAGALLKKKKRKETLYTPSYTVL